MLTLADIIQDLHALEIRLRAYERKYGITSADFYDLYQQGVLDDEGFEQSTEFARWASAYELKRKREAAFEGERLYWYDPQPHPNELSLASTHPHHKHMSPNIKRNRVPAPGLSFIQPNLPFLIGEIERDVLTESANNP